MNTYIELNTNGVTLSGDTKFLERESKVFINNHEITDIDTFFKVAEENTKLQQENKQLKLELLEKKCSDKDVEYQEKLKLQERIDKAIGYINFIVLFNQNINGKFSETLWGEELLEILKGDSNE